MQTRTILVALQPSIERGCGARGLCARARDRETMYWPWGVGEKVSLRATPLNNWWVWPRIWSTFQARGRNLCMYIDVYLKSSGYSDTNHQLNGTVRHGGGGWYQVVSVDGRPSSHQSTHGSHLYRYQPNTLRSVDTHTSKIYFPYIKSY